jgi:hypothetical protein
LSAPNGFVRKKDEYNERRTLQEAKDTY